MKEVAIYGKRRVSKLTRVYFVFKFIDRLSFEKDSLEVKLIITFDMREKVLEETEGFKPEH